MNGGNCTGSHTCQCGDGWAVQALTCVSVEMVEIIVKHLCALLPV
jgi:hypothetical protein